MNVMIDNGGLYIGRILEQAASKHPETTITIDHDFDVAPHLGRTVTFATLADLVDEMASRLGEAGVRPGDHVSIYKSSNFDIFVLACAAARAGAVPVMLSPALDGATVGALLDRLPRPHLLTDRGKLDGPLAGIRLDDRLRQAIAVGRDRHPDAVSLSDFSGSPRRPPVRPDPDQPALLTHTSGTTGLPKLAVHSARTLRGRWQPQRRLAALIRTRETYAAHLSFVHSRMFLALAVALPKGMPAVIMNDPEPTHVADLFARIKPGFVETHPNSFMEWLGLANDPREPLRNVKYFSSTFDALHPGVVRRMLDATKRRSPLFLQFYGQSECGPLTARWYRKRTARRADGRCLGYPLIGTTHVRLVGRDGKRPTRENPGKIEVRTPGRVVTYFGEEERFAAERSGRWWRTGDVGYRTRLGCLHVLDREVDVIPSIPSTLEVEDVLLGRLEELSELVLVPGRRQEPLPVVCTRADEPLDLDRWSEAVADLPEMAAPIQIPLAELPRTATMKVRRLELTRDIQEHRTQ
ncbi:MAG TPA: class I adenylate-forming enzyme family protein [Streptosporangiaceae bacterium]|nr:class I adenylate-forming enzyme family protein [Streptosporangiaceae bacterium]